MPDNTTTHPSALDATFSPIEEIIEDIRAGKMVVIVDDEDRENEGDLIMAAAKVQPDDVNFMVRYGRGLVCRDFLDARGMASVYRRTVLNVHPCAYDAYGEFILIFCLYVWAISMTRGFFVHHRHDGGGGCRVRGAELRAEGRFGRVLRFTERDWERVRARRLDQR